MKVFTVDLNFIRVKFDLDLYKWEAFVLKNNMRASLERLFARPRVRGSELEDK